MQRRKLDIPVIREAIGKIVSMLTERKIRVTQRGTQACVKYDKKTLEITELNVPHIPDDASEEFVMAIQGFIDHEIGHVLFTDPAQVKEAFKAGDRVANVANMLEDVYVERKMAEAFYGSGHNLNILRDFFFAKIIRPQIDKALASGNTEMAQGSAMVAAFRAWGGQAAAMDFIADPKIAALVAPIKDKLGDLTDEFANVTSSKHATDLAKKVRAALEATKAPPAPPPPSSPPKGKGKGKGKSEEPPEEPPEPEAEGEPEPEDESEEEDAGSKPEPESKPEDEPKTEPKPEPEPGSAAPEEIGKDDEKDEDGEGAKTSSPGDDSDEEDPDFANSAGGEDEASPSEEEGAGTGSSGGSDEEASLHGEVDRGADDDGSSPPLGDLMDQAYNFDESVARAIAEQAHVEIKESEYPIFSTEWDKLEPGPIKCNDATITDMESALGPHVNAMAKSLERSIAAQDRKMWTPGQPRGRIAPGSLYRVPTGNDRVFRKRTMTKAKNTAVELLVDCSGSMWGEKIKTAAASALAMSTVLERIRVKNEVMGFTTGNGREMSKIIDLEGSAVRWARCEPLYLPIFKAFDQRLDVNARKRLGHLYEVPGWLRNNIDGESLQIAAHRLRGQNVERRILIVFSDGRPAGDGDGFAAHLKKTVREIEKSGIEVIGVGINDASVKSFYSKHVVISKVSDLPEKVIGEMTKMLLA